MKCEFCSNKAIWTWKVSLCREHLKQNKDFYIKFLESQEILLDAIQNGEWTFANGTKAGKYQLVR